MKPQKLYTSDQLIQIIESIRFDTGHEFSTKYINKVCDSLIETIEKQRSDTDIETIEKQRSDTESHRLTWRKFHKKISSFLK